MITKTGSLLRAAWSTVLKDIQTSDYCHTEEEEGQERSDKYIDSEQALELQVQATTRSKGGGTSGRDVLGESRTFSGSGGLQEAKFGVPVLIAVRCIAAIGAAGTAYESINQSINHVPSHILY